VPAAYLNFILFDKNYKVLDAGWQPAPATTFTKQKLSFPTKDIKEEGYMYVWLSYDDDSNNWVYFDDFKVTHTPSNVIQYNEYYPFGLQTSNSWTRTNSSNSLLYNEGNELNKTSGWYETMLRTYDPAIGRFMQVDPLAYVTRSLSPFQYANNNPALLNDPLGLTAEVIDEIAKLLGGGYTYGGTLSESSKHCRPIVGAIWLLAD
jgi:RHS repeat-associated protein